MSVVTTYTIRVSPADLDGGFVGHVAELPGVASQGETVLEAVAATAEALVAVLEVRERYGLDGP